MVLKANYSKITILPELSDLWLSYEVQLLYHVACDSDLVPEACGMQPSLLLFSLVAGVYSLINKQRIIRLLQNINNINQ
jgi:hypothetical protein